MHLTARWYKLSTCYFLSSCRSTTAAFSARNNKMTALRTHGHVASHWQNSKQTATQTATVKHSHLSPCQL
jgi:hypothetical protein